MANTLPLRSEINEADTWDLSAYYPTDDDWERAYQEIEASLGEYEQYHGHLAEGADMVYGCLQLDDALGEKIDRLYVYAHQKNDQDTGDSRYQKLFGRAYDLYSRLCTASSFISVELTALGQERLWKMMEEKPELGLYERLFAQLLKRKDHMLSEEEEALLAKMSQIAGTASDVFGKFNNADLAFQPAVDAEGNTHALSHGTFIHCLESTDRVLRKSAYESFYTSYKNFRNTLAATYNAGLKEHSFYARIRGYKGPLEYSLESNDIPTAVYGQLIEAVHEGLPQMYRYVALRKEMLGLNKIHLYDVYVPVVKAPERTYTFEEAKEIVLAALAPMGEEYVGLLKKAFEERWIDVYENQGKRSGAYSISSYDVHPYVLMNFNGSLNSVFTLAHEMGHSLHSWYSNHTQPFVYANYRLFVAEVASTCNEALLNHYLMEHAENEEQKAYILNSYLDSFKGTIFRQTMFAEFEKITHEKVWNGEVLTADELCEIYENLNKLYYGPDMDMDEYIGMEWARIPHFYRNFYVYQYATGFSAAIALSNRILTLGEAGVKEYMKFLTGGSSKDPIELLKMAGVDMTTKAPIEEAMKVFAGLLDDLEEQISELYKKFTKLLDK